jgi:hypothetical protein
MHAMAHAYEDTRTQGHMHTRTHMYKDTVISVYCLLKIETNKPSLKLSN